MLDALRKTLYIATAIFTGGTFVTADQKLIDGLRAGGYPEPVLHVDELAAQLAVEERV